MPQPVPTLILRSPGVPGLYTLNDTVCGEVGAGVEALHYPISLNAQCVVTFTPTSSPKGMLLFPVTRTLRFLNGELEQSAYPPDHMRITVWPMGVYDVTLEPLGMDAPVIPRIVAQFDRTLGDWSGSMLIAREGEKNCLLICDERGRFLFDHNLPMMPLESLSCEVESLSEAAPPMLTLRGGSDAHTYLLALSYQAGFAIAAEIAADEIISEPVLCARVQLHDSVERHIETPYVYMDGVFVPSQKRLLNTPRLPYTPQQSAQAFFEAALLGLWEEAMNYLTPSLREGLDMEGIQEFLGEFTGVEPCAYWMPSDATCALALRYPQNDCVCHMRVYGMLFERMPNGMYRIDNLWEP